MPKCHSQFCLCWLNFRPSHSTHRLVPTLTKTLLGQFLRIISIMYHTLELLKPFTCISFDPLSDATVRVGIIPFHRQRTWDSLWTRDLLKITQSLWWGQSSNWGYKYQSYTFSFFFLLLPWFLSHWLRMKPEYQNALWSPAKDSITEAWAHKNPGYLPLLVLPALTSVPPKSAQWEASRCQQRGPLKALIQLPF